MFEVELDPAKIFIQTVKFASVKLQSYTNIPTRSILAGKPLLPFLPMLIEDNVRSLKVGRLETDVTTVVLFLNNSIFAEDLVYRTANVSIVPVVMELPTKL